MSELQLSTDTLAARRDELTLHLMDSDYLTEARKESIRRELARIAFELGQRAGDE